jgi:hypothetical protein
VRKGLTVSNYISLLVMLSPLRWCVVFIESVVFIDRRLSKRSLVSMRRSTHSYSDITDQCYKVISIDKNKYVTVSLLHSYYLKRMDISGQQFESWDHWDRADVPTSPTQLSHFRFLLYIQPQPTLRPNYHPTPVARKYGERTWLGSWLGYMEMMMILWHMME